MDARKHQHISRSILPFIFFILYASDISTAQTETNPGDIPIVNPTTPGTSPIVNPTAPPPPATTTGPPTTTTGPPSTTTSGGSWCIANPSASQTALQVALDYACGYGGADCSAIQQGASCYDPNTVADHASYAFNDYYQKNPAPTSCVFGGSAQLTNTDPSRGNCRYASPTTTLTPPTTVPTPATPIPMTPPSITSPVGPYPPGGFEPTAGYDYGPTSTPSSAETLGLNLRLLFSSSCFVLAIFL